MTIRLGVLGLGTLLAAASAASATPTIYTDTHGDQVGSTSKARDIWSVSVDNDLTNLIITVNLDPAANLGTSSFNFGVGLTTGPGAGGDTSANAITHGNPYQRTISIDSSLGGMTAWIGAFPAGTGANPGTAANPWSSYGFNDYVWNSSTQSWGTQVHKVANGMPLTSQPGGTTPSTFTLTVPMADLSTLNLHVGSTFYFDVYDTGTSAGQTAYDSLANPSPTNNLGEVSAANTPQYNGTILVSYTIHAVGGDANTDGRIDADDYALVDRGYAAQLTGWSNGDFNNDGVVDAADYLILDTAYGHQTGAFSSSFLDARAAAFGEGYVQSLLAAVPEPTSFGLLSLVAVPMLARRRGR